MQIYKGLKYVLISLVFLVWLGIVISQMLLDDAPEHPLNWQPDRFLARSLFQKTANAAQHHKTLRFNENELNHGVNSILNRFIKSRTQITLNQGNLARISTSLNMKKWWEGKYLNAEFSLVNRDQSLRIIDLNLGWIPLPNSLAEALINHVLEHSILKHYYRLAMEHIRSIQLENQEVIIDYEINTLNSNYNNFATQIKPESLKFYQLQIEEVVSHHDNTTRLSLSDLLKPLFQSAAQRGDGNRAITENIALIYAVAAYVNANEIPFYLPLKPVVNAKQPTAVFAYKRSDYAKHFMLSAALTCTGGPALADLFGQEKELRDAQSVSGFSFVDLAADRAGIKFAELATYSPDSARTLQLLMAKIEDYRDFIPDFLDLPEKMPYGVFTHRFDAINSKAYKKVMRDIDQRIASLPLYQHP